MAAGTRLPTPGAELTPLKGEPFGGAPASDGSVERAAAPPPTPLKMRPGHTGAAPFTPAELWSLIAALIVFGFPVAYLWLVALGGR